MEIFPRPVRIAPARFTPPDDGATSAHVALESPYEANCRDSTLFARRNASSTGMLTRPQTAGAADSDSDAAAATGSDLAESEP